MFLLQGKTEDPRNFVNFPEIFFFHNCWEQLFLGMKTLLNYLLWLYQQKTIGDSESVKLCWGILRNYQENFVVKNVFVSVSYV